MFSATFFFLGLAVCIFAGLICYAIASSIKATKPLESPANERAAWEQIKTALLELHSRYESTETPKQKALRSWAGTLLICAGLCMIGILMEVEYDRVISADSIFAGFLGESQIQQIVQQCRTPKAALTGPAAKHRAASKGSTAPSATPAATPKDSASPDEKRVPAKTGP